MQKQLQQQPRTRMRTQSGKDDARHARDVRPLEGQALAVLLVRSTFLGGGAVELEESGLLAGDAVRDALRQLPTHAPPHAAKARKAREREKRQRRGSAVAATAATATSAAVTTNNNDNNNNNNNVQQQLEP
jgi:hypothetical protein